MVNNPFEISGFTIFSSCPPDEKSVSEAVQYCKENGLTQEKVRIVKGEKSIMVKVK